MPPWPRMRKSCPSSERLPRGGSEAETDGHILPDALGAPGGAGLSIAQVPQRLRPLDGDVDAVDLPHHLAFSRIRLVGRPPTEARQHHAYSRVVRRGRMAQAQRAPTRRHRDGLRVGVRGVFLEGRASNPTGGNAVVRRQHPPKNDRVSLTGDSVRALLEGRKP